MVSVGLDGVDITGLQFRDLGHPRQSLGLFDRIVYRLACGHRCQAQGCQRADDYLSKMGHAQ